MLNFVVLSSSAEKYKLVLGSVDVTKNRIFWGAVAGPNVLVVADTDGGREPSLTTLPFTSESAAENWLRQNRKA